MSLAQIRIHPHRLCSLLAVLALTLASACDPTAIGEIGWLDDQPAVQGDTAGGATLFPFITDGQNDPGHPSAGGLGYSGISCTGTLIGTRTVLTAGHCVGGTTYFRIGGGKYVSSAIYRHPNYGGGNYNDVALVVLSQAVQGVAPTPIATSAPQQGQQITLVGFGKTAENASDYGVKRYTTNTIGKVTSTTFSFYGGKNICNGDSGGPTYASYNGQEVVIGVHSTKSGWCGNGGTDMRVDPYKDWLVQMGGSDVVIEGSKANPGTPPTPPTPPSGGAASEGQDCSSKSCDTGLACVTVKSNDQVVGQYCMETCTTLGSDPVCDGGEVCTKSSQGPVCFLSGASSSGYTHKDPNEIPKIPGTPPTPPSGTTAAEGEDCSVKGCAAGLACTTVLSNNQTIGRWCMEQCKTAGTDPNCDGNEVCTASASGMVCFDAGSPQSGYTNKSAGGGSTTPPPQTGQATEGQSCASTTCASGLACVKVLSNNSPVGQFCMEKCATPGSDPACDGGEVCTSSSVGPVCFHAGNSQSGYTNPKGGGSSGGTPPPGTPPPGGSAGACGDSQESEVFKLLNQVRASNGLGSLACDTTALKVARAHSQDMCNKNYFSHTNKQGQQPWDRLKAGGVSFSAAGENIAYGYSSPQSVHNGWMNSSGHRKNMLTASWQRAAIGLYNCGGTLYWTEVFMR